MPRVNILARTVKIILNGTSIFIKQAITINGPNGMYSFFFFILVASRKTLIIAANKNAISIIVIVFASPK